MDKERWSERFRFLWFIIVVVLVLFGIMWIAVMISEMITQDLDTRVSRNYIYYDEICD